MCLIVDLNLLSFRLDSIRCRTKFTEEGVYLYLKSRIGVYGVILSKQIVGFSMSRLNDFHLTGVENDHVLWEFKPSQQETAPSMEICRNGKVRVYGWCP